MTPDILTQFQDIKLIQDKILYINDDEKRRLYYRLELEKQKLEARIYPPKFQKGLKQLVYISSQRDTKRVEGTTIDFIKNTTESFKPELILVEDNSRIAKLAMELEFCKNLAKYENIPLELINPVESEKIGFLLERGYSKDEIYLRYAIYALADFFNTHEEYTASEADFQVELEKLAHALNRICNWNYDFSFSNFRHLYKQFTDFDFDINDRRSYVNYVTYTLFDVESDWQKFNIMNADIIYFQDREAVKNIYLALQKYNKILVVTTGLHYSLQKPALKKMFDLIS